MGKDSAIGWTHHTFNPWWGCEKPLVEIGGKMVISPECLFCYAEVWDHRWGGKNWGHTAPRRFFGEKHWKEPFAWDREAKAAGERHRVFCASMGDVLENRWDLDKHRERLWIVISNTPNLDWLLLTKRADMLEDRVPEWVWALPNVWPGVSAGTQEMADLRLPFLLRLKKRYPHLVAWVSVEPMLSPVRLWKLASLDWHENTIGYETYPLAGLQAMPDCDWKHGKLDWVVIGGESGPKARPFDVTAARILMDDCRAHGVPVFWKQFGSRPFERDTRLTTLVDDLICDHSLRFKHPAGADPSEWPEWAKVQELPR